MPGHRGRAYPDTDLPRLKIYAREQAYVARLRGELVMSPCEVGTDCFGRIHGHHRNGYLNPLDVVWLCARHHNKEHAEMRRRAA